MEAFDPAWPAGDFERRRFNELMFLIDKLPALLKREGSTEFDKFILDFDCGIWDLGQRWSGQGMPYLDVCFCGVCASSEPALLSLSLSLSSTKNVAGLMKLGSSPCDE